MAWTFKEDRSIYSQLVEQIKMGIASGKWTPGAKLPSVRDLAEEAGVNPNTMQRKRRSCVFKKNERKIYNGGG